MVSRGTGESAALTFGPRLRSALATRAALLDAAIRRFTRDGYDDVGMRDVAGDVGIDAALVVRYFGSKEALFEAALDACFDGDDFWEGDRPTVGERLSHEIVYGSRNASKLQGLLIILRSMGSAKAMDVIRASCAEDFIQPLTDWLGGEDAPVRARLMAGLIMGMSLTREISGPESLSPEACERLRLRLAGQLQALADG